MTPVPKASTRVAFDPSSRSKLTRRDLGRFTDTSLFHAVARVVCEAECLPRKELFESWEVARRVRRRFRGGRVVDLACGHGLLAYLLLLLDDTSPAAVAADVVLPPSSTTLAVALEAAWPRLAGRVALEQKPVSAVALTSDDLVVSVHACGGLTDAVLARAMAASARVAVLPCCQDARHDDQGSTRGWLEPTLSIDVERVVKLRVGGYAVRTERIPAGITEKNRLIVAEPASRAPPTETATTSSSSSGRAAP